MPSPACTFPARSRCTTLSCATSRAAPCMGNVLALGESRTCPGLMSHAHTSDESCTDTCTDLPLMSHAHASWRLPPVMTRRMLFVRYSVDSCGPLVYTQPLPGITQPVSLQTSKKRKAAEPEESSKKSAGRRAGKVGAGADTAESAESALLAITRQPFDCRRAPPLLLPLRRRRMMR
jgi:hypothetical protein